MDVDVILQLGSLHVSTDGSYDLLERVKWANEHDEACQEISKRATEFMEHLWMSKQAKRDTKYLQKALVKS